MKSNPEKNNYCQSLLDRMTLEEKIGQMVQFNENWKLDFEKTIRAGGVGSLLTMRDPHNINKFQRIAVEESRLGIPLLIGNDVIHGYRTTFPIPLALAGTWDTQLVEEIARESMREAVACGTTWTFTPMVDISRDPRWGRIAESGGEDPYLNSQMARAWTRGIQSYHDANGRCAAACVKHYAAYGAAESGKDYNSVDMSERRLREEYLPPYRAAVEAGVKTVMTSFNDLNGTPATANKFLLQQVLRREWGFEGLVISDFDAIGELVHHGFARDLKEAALRSILAGVDIDMMGYAYPLHLADLVHEGKVPEALIDASVLRILGLKYDLGLFDHPYIDESAVHDTLLTPAALDLAEKAAAESIVLLKNEGDLLPLPHTPLKVALIGPMAEERASLLGCWYFNGHTDEVETLAEALEHNLPAGSTLIVEPGCSLGGNDLDLAAITAAASQADLVLLAIGEHFSLSGEAHSRAHLDLPGRQPELVRAVAASGKPVVGLLFTGRPLTIPELVDSVSALLLPYHGGNRAAQAVCDVLFGVVNPAAKLTTSFPRCEGQVPVYYAHKSTGRPIDSEGIIQFDEVNRSNYLDETNDPLFPFGFGLSYAKFEYSDLNLSSAAVKPDGTLTVSTQITNTGKVAGSEIAQLYIRDLAALVTRPVKQLKGYRKVTLQPGESCRVEFTLSPADLSFLDEEFQPIIEPGSMRVWIGPNSQEGLMGSFEIVA